MFKPKNTAWGKTHFVRKFSILSHSRPKCVGPSLIFNLESSTICIVASQRVTLLDRVPALVEILLISWSEKFLRSFLFSEKSKTNSGSKRHMFQILSRFLVQIKRKSFLLFSANFFPPRLFHTNFSKFLKKMKMNESNYPSFMKK